jgi:hypothetical protein
MKQRIMMNGIVAVVGVAGLMYQAVAGTCNGAKICCDRGSASPCSGPGVSCTRVVRNPDPCVSCVAGGPTDDCTVESWQTGTVTIYSNGLCYGDSPYSYCAGGDPGDPGNDTCASETHVDINCTPGG